MLETDRETVCIIKIVTRWRWKINIWRHFSIDLFLIEFVSFSLFGKPNIKHFEGKRECTILKPLVFILSFHAFASVRPLNMRYTTWQWKKKRAIIRMIILYRPTFLCAAAVQSYVENLHMRSVSYIVCSSAGRVEESSCWSRFTRIITSWIVQLILLILLKQLYVFLHRSILIV